MALYPPPAELASLRATFRELMLSGTTVKVLALSEGVDDAWGRAVSTFAAAGDVEAQQATVLQSRTRQLVDGIWGTVAEWQAILAYGAEVKSGDRVLDVGTGLLWEVQTATLMESDIGAEHTMCSIHRVDGNVL